MLDLKKKGRLAAREQTDCGTRPSFPDAKPFWDSAANSANALTHLPKRLLLDVLPYPKACSLQTCSQSTRPQISCKSVRKCSRFCLMFVQLTCWKISKTVTVKLLLPIKEQNMITMFVTKGTTRSKLLSFKVRKTVSHLVGNTEKWHHSKRQKRAFTQLPIDKFTRPKHETINVADMNPAELKAMIGGSKSCLAVGNVRYSFGSRTCSCGGQTKEHPTPRRRLQR